MKLEEHLGSGGIGLLAIVVNFTSAPLVHTYLLKRLFF